MEKQSLLSLTNHQVVIHLHKINNKLVKKNHLNNIN